MLDPEFFEPVTDARGRTMLALKNTVPQRLLHQAGLVMDGAPEKDGLVAATQLPITVLREVKERCIYTAGFATVEEGVEFPSPVQLVSIPCRSASGDGRCMRLDNEQRCTLFGFFSSVESPTRQRVHLIIAPILPGLGVSMVGRALLVEQRERYLHSLRHWELMLTPVNLALDATIRGMRFWMNLWFGKS
ncbi:hypothetical protein SIID45300_01261 [Candidatus Magnetaquicoccaceae bacterium FCR-1]|uniref:Uncharacterized protein n=1 Tax=Candidatus Magnetaquiglobus chichijimensis TaxID=3141448 RepID=A0ABQ0C8C5_9PROT